MRSELIPDAVCMTAFPRVQIAIFLCVASKKPSKRMLQKQEGPDHMCLCNRAECVNTQCANGTD